MLKNILITLGISAATLLSACRPAAPAVLHEQITGFDSFVSALEANGEQVSFSGGIEQPFLSIPGQVIEVNGQGVQVFEFPTLEEAEQLAAEISPDGSSVGTSMVAWVAPPHFFRAGRLIAVYVDEDTSVLVALDAVLGPQFAGR